MFGGIVVHGALGEVGAAKENREREVGLVGWLRLVVSG